MNPTITFVLIAIVGTLAAYQIWRRIRGITSKTSMEEVFDDFLRSKAAIIVLLAMMSQSYAGQLFLNSGGIVLISHEFTKAYLIASAVLATLSFSLFEIMLVRLVMEMFARSSTITYPKWKWSLRIGALAVVSLYNMYSLALLNYNIWPTGGPPHPIGLYGPLSISPVDWAHAAIYSAILFLSGTMGEQKAGAEEEAVRAQDEILRGLVKDAKQEARSKAPGQAMTALIALAPKEVKRFFGNYANIMTGQVSREDVLAHAGVEGDVIEPGYATKKKALEEAAKRKVSANGAGGNAPTQGDGRGVAEWTLADVLDAGYTIDLPRTLEASEPITQMSQMLGLARNKLTNVFQEYEMTPAGEGGAARTKQVTYWQICALIEFQLIPMPPFIHKAAEVDA